MRCVCVLSSQKVTGEMRLLRLTTTARVPSNYRTSIVPIAPSSVHPQSEAQLLCRVSRAAPCVFSQFYSFPRTVLFFRAVPRADDNVYFSLLRDSRIRSSSLPPLRHGRASGKCGKCGLNLSTARTINHRKTYDFFHASQRYVHVTNSAETCITP